MAGRLLDQGFPLSVWNRTAAKAQPLTAAGALAPGTVAAAVREADVVLLSLSDAEAVESALLADGGATDAIKPGAMIVNTSTVSPEAARRLGGRLGGLGLPYLDVAVLGNPLQARAGEVRLLAAGSGDDVAAARPVLDALAKQVVYVGVVGLAATTKLVFNALLGAQLASLAEAVSYGVSAGLDLNGLLAAIAHSGFSSQVMAFRADLVQRRAYQPAAFRAALMGKDLDLVLAEAERYGVRAPLLQSARAHFSDAVEAGDGDLDAAIVIQRLVDAGAAVSPGDVR
jgi:3-hydroxyisobutyrate dehydrogenase-like beta-hydroxyacid dehydrogenase